MDDSPPISPAERGRGATLNQLSRRFDDRAREVDGDWLDARETLDGAPVRRTTEVMIERPRTIITRNGSPDIPFDRSINAFRGCEHGCIYCFARPTHAYLNLSPGLDFESRLFAKPDAPALLERELSRKGYVPEPIALGTNTDPYQPIEARYRITRSILEVLSRFNHPVTITTKSARVTDDIELLASMAQRGLVLVMLSVTTLDPEIARRMEPRASTPRKRLAAIRTLAEAGVPVDVSLSPVIPALTDHEIEAILAAAAEAGASGAYSLLVRLPHEVSPLFRAWLAEHYPDRARRIMALIQEARGGRDNDGDYHSRFSPKGAYAAAIRARFKAACRRHGLGRTHFALRTDLFSPPGPQQLALL